MSTVHTLTIKDQLKHPGYNWPVSLVFLPVPLTVENCGGSRFALLGEQGQQVPVQMVEGKAAFLTDLPCGAEKVFQLYTAEEDIPLGADTAGLLTSQEEGRIHIRTSLFRLDIQKDFRGKEEKIELFSIVHSESGITGRGILHAQKELQAYEALLEEEGPVFAIARVTLHFEDGSSYSLKLRIVDTLDFMELEEEAAGFHTEDNSSFEILWESFTPEYRSSEYRIWEKTDEYTDEDGVLPFHLLPYDSWVSWWSTKYAAFIDKQTGYGTGIFVKNGGDWEDGTYGLWRSGQKLAVTFRYDGEEVLRFHYPLVSGYRSTAVSIYPAACEEDGDFRAKAGGDGLYGMAAESPLHYPYVHRQWFWQEFIPLDKIRNWSLRWRDEQSAYPRFFPPESLGSQGTELWYLGNCRKPVQPVQFEKVIYEMSNSMNQLITTGPVSNREFFDWVIMFDMAAPYMTEEQFDNARACFAFMAYILSEENYMPVLRTLSGHPNFLADGRACGGLAAALFPKHPEAPHWRDLFELAMARNLKYHTRPAVKKWGAKGGRWTENLGCYVFAAVNPMVKIQALLARTYGENVLLYPNFTLVARYLLDMLSAPVDGVRRYPPAGAHSGAIWDPIMPPFTMALLAEQLFCYEPLLAEYWRHESYPEARDIEERRVGTNLYRSLAGKEYPDKSGTRPPLKSEKYTGLGFVLRANVHTGEEVSVHLLQIDEGPNYRWGRGAKGGCGNIWYYAGGKRYSAQRPEDVGDWNKGDVQSCSNFGVLRGHEFCSIGRNELKRPLYDFGFTQYAQLDAASDLYSVYHSRSVLLSGGDYIIIYDAVGDRTVHGRFSWFQKQGEAFPSIVQIKPGSPYVETDGGIPIDEPGRQPDNLCTGRYYDGYGDFLTLVSHLPVNSDRAMYTTRTEYGARVELQGRTDFIFRSETKIRYADSRFGFTGYGGIIRSYGITYAQAALFRGNSIRVREVEAVLKGSGVLPDAGIGLTVKDGQVWGTLQCQEEITLVLSCGFTGEGYRLYLDGVAVDGQETGCFTVNVPQGSFSLEYTSKAPAPAVPEIEKTVVSSGEAMIYWKAAAGAQSYVLEGSRDCGESWYPLAETEENCYRIQGLDNGMKLHVRVAGINAGTRGAFCWDYPIYITEKEPLKADGLRVSPAGKDMLVTWGKQLGVSGYRLYRRHRREEEFILIYEGEASAFTDTDIDIDTDAVTDTDMDMRQEELYEYTVSAVNGNGEGQQSNIRSTAQDGLAYWDPEPDRKFRRYLPSHEYGYRGFDKWESYASGEAEPYPE